MDEWMRELIGVVEGEGGSGLVKVFLGIGRGGGSCGTRGLGEKEDGKGQCLVGGARVCVCVCVVVGIGEGLGREDVKCLGYGGILGVGMWNLMVTPP